MWFGAIAAACSIIRQGYFSTSGDQFVENIQETYAIDSVLYSDTRANPHQAGTLALESPLPPQVAELHYAGQGTEHGDLALAEPGLEGTVAYATRRSQKS